VSNIDPFRVSANRVDKYLTCGYAFKLNYEDDVPPQRTASALLFGSVIHRALEAWSQDRTGMGLADRVHEAWLEETKDTPIRMFLLEYGTLGVQARQLVADIRESRPDIKSPRATKEFKESDVRTKQKVLLDEWLPELNKSRYHFTKSDPLQNLYDESLTLADAYEARWCHLPKPYVTEVGFEFTWKKWRLNGRIDSVEQVVDRDTGEMRLGVIDYKTYGQQPSEHKDRRQLVMYDLAVRYLSNLGTLPAVEPWELIVGLDFVRWTDRWTCNPREFWRISQEDYDWLERDLENYSKAVGAGIYLPASKGTNVDHCDYPGLCCLRTCAGVGGSSEKVLVSL
jgi:hypothetical protein